ncbi:MAG: hypothetical protein U9R25_01980 [Chloroflexota bacterium]|nr:hypothetical protein [Chloroflexota bacterium]
MELLPSRIMAVMQRMDRPALMDCSLGADRCQVVGMVRTENERKAGVGVVGPLVRDDGDRPTAMLNCAAKSSA